MDWEGGSIVGDILSGIGENLKLEFEFTEVENEEKAIGCI